LEILKNISNLNHNWQLCSLVLWPLVIPAITGIFEKVKQSHIISLKI